MKAIYIIDNRSLVGGQNLLIGLSGIQQKIGHEATVLALEPYADLLV